MYPTIKINLKNIIDNIKNIKKLCDAQNIHLSVVTKLLVDNKEVVQAIVDSGVESICESRIQNLISYKDIQIEKWLIREPMLSEISDVVKYTDVSLNSEMATIRELDKEANKQNKVHKIILMYEIGDLREGCLREELGYVIEESIRLKNIEVYGIGINISCYGEIIPTDENMRELDELVKELEKKYNIKFKMVSGGNSSSYKMLKEGKLPRTINNLRLGESVFLGNVPCFDEKIENLNYDNFILEAQIVELKEKPSVPKGTMGYANSFAEQTTFIDRGIRKRALIGIGKQDVKPEDLYPTDDKIIILGGSSDYIILDVSDCEKQYKVGDILEFKMNYAGTLRLMASKYVERKIIK